MTRADAAIIVGTTVVTAFVSSALLGALGQAYAKDGSPQPEARAVTVKGVKIKATMDKTQYKSGSSPIVRLTLENPRGEGVTLNFRLLMYTMEPASMMSRMPFHPRQRWDKPCVVSLAKGETKCLVLPTNTPLSTTTATLVLAVDKAQHHLTQFAVGKVEPLKRLRAAPDPRSKPAVQPKQG